MPPEVNHWPRRELIGTVVDAECPRCQRRWTVHPVLSGYRLRCTCGRLIYMPWGPRRSLASAEAVERDRDGA